MNRKFLTAALFAIALAPAAHAADSVAYGDLNLGTAAGRTELTNRIQAAAGTACSSYLTREPDSEPSIRENQVLYRACVGRISQRAMARVASDRGARLEIGRN